MTVDEQIKHLNNTVKCTLKPSPIHGIGVFALRDIEKGEYLYCLLEPQIAVMIPTERLSEVRKEILDLILDRWPQTTQPSDMFSPNSDVNLLSFMNHSATPNSLFNRAVRAIKAGEEITEDYDTGNLSDLQKQHYNFI